MKLFFNAWIEARKKARRQEVLSDLGMSIYTQELATYDQIKDLQKQIEELAGYLGFAKDNSFFGVLRDRGAERKYFFKLKNEEDSGPNKATNPIQYGQMVKE